METVNEIDVIGDPDRVKSHVYRLAANIQDWPKILPHYRYMHILEEGEDVVVADYGASRDGIPVRWRARQERFPAEHRIVFVHIGGVTKGMWVEWRLEPRGDRVHVTIEHRLTYAIPVLGPWFAKHVVGRLFVENIAGKTLRRIKAIVEGDEVSG